MRFWYNALCLEDRICHLFPNNATVVLSYEGQIGFIDGPLAWLDCLVMEHGAKKILRLQVGPETLQLWALEYMQYESDRFPIRHFGHRGTF